MVISHLKDSSMSQQPSQPADQAGKSPYASTHDEILQAVRENSVQRGLFFLKNLAALDFDRIVEAIEQRAKTYDMEVWREAAASAGIAGVALDILDSYHPPIPYPYYFCLPAELVDEPRLILYYRNVAMVSNKVMNNIGLDTTQYEVGAPLDLDKAGQIASHLNQILSALVQHTDLHGENRHIEMAYTNIGASLDGGWRNEVGRLAYTSILNPLIIYLHQLGKLNCITYKLKGRIVLDEDEDEQPRGRPRRLDVVDLTPAQLEVSLASLNDNRVVFRQLDLTNGNRILLNRQLYWIEPGDGGRKHRIGPDLLTQVQRPDEESIEDARYPWAGELKGGADPAGSDEHWKTATRAFSRIMEAAEKTQRPRPMLSFLATILVDRVAEEADLMLERGELTSVYNLTKIANDPALHQQFLDDMVRFFEAQSVDE
jgi:hypothetical protein